MNRMRADAWALAGLSTMLALCCVLGCYRALTAVFLHVPLDPNEGWNAYHAAAAMHGMAVYPDRTSMFFNNYPPLSLYVVGALGLALGDEIFAGRIISLLSFLVATSAIVAIARTMHARRLAALFGALFLAAGLLLFSDYVGMDDPQLLGHAMQLGALFPIVREPRKTGVLILAALLFVAALFVKHNLVTVPLAAIVWLAIVDRMSALRFTGAIAGIGIAGLILFRLTFGSELLGHLASSRVWSLENLEAGLDIALPMLLVPFAGLMVMWCAHRHDRHLLLCVLYAVFALLIATISLSGAGVDSNALFDVAIASSLGAALILDRLIARGFATLFAASAALPMLFTLLTTTDGDWYTSAFWFHPWVDEAQTADADIALLRAAKGPALCETLSFCYWAGKDPTVDVFNLGQAYKTGARSDGELISRIQGRYFGVLQFESLTSFQLTPGIRAAIGRNYALSRNDEDGYFFLPRQGRKAM